MNNGELGKPDKPMGATPAAPSGRPITLIAALKVSVGKPPSSAMRLRRPDDIDDRNA